MMYFDSQIPTTTNAENDAIKGASFVGKIHLMLKDPACKDHIQWDSEGIHILILNIQRFSDSVLPRYFKHANYSSFVRILNKHGFHKIKTDCGEACFFHTHFKKNTTNLSKVKKINAKELTSSYSSAHRVSANDSGELKNCQEKLQEMSKNFKTMEDKTAALREMIADQNQMISQLNKEIAMLSDDKNSMITTFLNELKAKKRLDAFVKEIENPKSYYPSELQNNYSHKKKAEYSSNILSEKIRYSKNFEGLSGSFTKNASKFDKNQGLSEFMGFHLNNQMKNQETSEIVSDPNFIDLSPTAAGSGNFYEFYEPYEEERVQNSYV